MMYWNMEREETCNIEHSSQTEGRGRVGFSMKDKNWEWAWLPHAAWRWHREAKKINDFIIIKFELVTRAKMYYLQIELRANSMENHSYSPSHAAKRWLYVCILCICWWWKNWIPMYHLSASKIDARVPVFLFHFFFTFVVANYDFLLKRKRFFYLLRLWFRAAAC